MKYTSKKYDITIIEIKESDEINDYFDIELNEDNIINIKKTIYILHYPYDKNISVSYGILNEIYEDEEYEFNHFCTTYGGSSGSPILYNIKIIGVYKGAKGNKYNLGTFINYPINEFIKQNYIDNKLIEFNNKFNLNIKANIKKLNLNSKKIECINYLQNLALTELKELYLSSCEISDISILEKVKFEKLKN